MFDSDHGSELNCDDLTYCHSDDHECDYFSDSMEPLTIVLGNNHYSMPPEAYMFTGDGVNNNKCTVAISYLADSTGMFILGDTFLRNFVTTFDNDHTQMVLAINTNAPEGVSIEFKLSGAQIFGIIVACIAVVACIAAAVYYGIQYRKKQK